MRGAGGSGAASECTNSEQGQDHHPHKMHAAGRGVRAAVLFVIIRPISAGFLPLSEFSDF